MERFCQSCAMPLAENIRGSESDGSKSEEYCKYCYENSEFRNKNITYEEMLKVGLEGIDKSPNSKFKKWMFKKSYPALLKKCKRWS